MTIGEDRVRASFNPSGNSDVDTLKNTTASLINLVEDIKSKDPRLAALAQTYYELACMLAVKLATTDVKKEEVTN